MRPHCRVVRRISAVSVLILSSTAAPLVAEEEAIVTFYPSPNGIYEELVAERLTDFNAGNYRTPPVPGQDWFVDPSAAQPSISAALRGWVALGTFVPLMPLHLKQQDARGVLIESNSAGASANTPRMYLVDTALTGQVTSAPAWALDNLADRLRVFRQPTISTAGTEFMTVLNTGNVGIGSPAPLEKLHVEGTGIFFNRTNGEAAVIAANEQSAAKKGRVWLGTDTNGNSYMEMVSTAAKAQYIDFIADALLGESQQAGQRSDYDARIIYDGSAVDRLYIQAKNLVLTNHLGPSEGGPNPPTWGVSIGTVVTERPLLVVGTRAGRHTAAFKGNNGYGIALGGIADAGSEMPFASIQSFRAGVFNDFNASLEINTGPGSADVIIGAPGNTGQVVDINAPELHANYLVVEPQASGSGEGGEIQLKGAAPNPDWQVDVLSNRLRVHSSGLERLSILSNGNIGVGTANPGARLQVNGSFAATTKNFEIRHPLHPETQLLRHSVIEGPEIAVYYRGTGRLVDGVATVGLPNYFDALTRDGTATVALTARGAEPFLLSYEQFNERSFIVHGTASDGAFDWEVKAVRADVPALIVEPPQELKDAITAPLVEP